MKKKRTTAILAFFLGVLGVHRFYLGQRLLGILTIALTVITVILSIAADGPVVFVAFLLSLIDAVLFAVMPRLDFDEKFNAKYLNNNKEAEDWENWPEELAYEQEEPLTKAAALAAVPSAPAEEKLSLDLLDQISHYGKLRDQGLLTEEEFDVLKKRIL